MKQDVCHFKPTLRGKEDIMPTDIPFCYFFALHTPPPPPVCMLFETLDYVSLRSSRASPSQIYMVLSASALSIRPIKRCGAHKTFSIWLQKRRKGMPLVNIWKTLSQNGSSNQSETDLTSINIKNSNLAATFKNRFIAVNASKRFFC